MKSLVEIIKERQEKIKEYEQKYGQDSYKREQLAKYENQRVKLTANIRTMKKKRTSKSHTIQVLLTEVVINQLEYQHFNLYLTPNSKNYKLLQKIVQNKQRVQMTVDIYSYKRKNSPYKTYGIKRAREIKAVEK